MSLDKVQFSLYEHFSNIWIKVVKNWLFNLLPRSIIQDVMGMSPLLFAEIWIYMYRTSEGRQSEAKYKRKNNKKRLAVQPCWTKKLDHQSTHYMAKNEENFSWKQKICISNLTCVEKKSNMLESTSGDPRGQDTEEALVNFSEEELEYVNAGTVEIRRAYLLGNEAKRYWRRTGSNTGMISSLKWLRRHSFFGHWPQRHRVSDV